MPSRFSMSVCLSLFAIAAFVISGCEKPNAPTTGGTTVAQTADDHGDDDHGDDDHGHDDHGHDHGEEHDHDGHDHDGHDHDEHGHDDHDHEGHDHGEEGHGEEGHGEEGHGEEGHDHGDHSHDFESLAPAVKELQSISDHIGEAFTSGKPGDAHDDLHHVGDLLGDMEKLVKNKLEGEEQTKASAAIEKLFEAFFAIDDKMHGNEGKEYSEVKDEITSALATLKDIAK